MEQKHQGKIYGRDVMKQVRKRSAVALEYEPEKIVRQKWLPVDAGTWQSVF